MDNVIRPQRVLYVVSLFPCWSETFIVREIDALIEAGVDVRILSLKRQSGLLIQSDAAKLLARVRAPRSPIPGLGYALMAWLRHPVRATGAAATIVAGTWRAPVVMLKSLGAFVRGIEHLAWVRHFDPELIHAHWATYPSTVAWALGRITRGPFGFTSHAHDIFLSRHLLSRKLQDAALAVTISRYNVEWLKCNVWPDAGDKLEVVHCGVDLERSHWRPHGRDKQLIVAVGRLHSIKGFDTLIEALALLRHGGRAFRCKLIGDGPMLAQLQALVREHGLQSHVELMGAQPQETVRQWLERAAVFALPSQVTADGGRDGIPVALMEAMASGSAVVSCRTSGIPELIGDGQQGLLVPQRDPHALAEALQRLLADSGLRSQYARAARKRIEQEFDARAQARKLRELMATAVGSPWPRRLLVVIGEMEVGGSQRQIVHLLTGLDRRRWQPELVYFRSDSFLVQRLRDAGIPVHHLPKRGRIDPQFLWRLAALLRRGDYDLIQAYSLTAELWTVLARTLCGRRPVIVASERNQRLDQPGSYWWAKRFVLGRSAAAIANSSAGARATARRTGVPAAFFDTVCNGVEIPPDMDPQQRAALRIELGVPADRAFGLFVGRLAPQKNLDCLVDAMASLPARKRPWLALVGEGPLRGHLQERILECGLGDAMSFTGERADATMLMQAADFLVLPSHFEGLSNALLEAMAGGCPVIASAVGGTPELIEHERTGLLFPPADAAGLAACIVRLWDDASLRARLSRQAREHVARSYGIALQVAATAAVYERCLSDAPARPGRPPTQPRMARAIRPESQAAAPGNAEYSQ